ncbi:MAG TPA: 50S ribosomal protein L4 [Gaiellaceae bacterium]|nr:50S ribosomal protein L4 [Gaiellaceae bacterium]
MAAPKAPILDSAGKKSKDATLEAAVFAAEVKPHLVHEAVRAELNAQRAGSRSLKTRGLVAGGRGKPWRQKGTGRARAGTIRAPQWTGGGAAFQPRTNFQVKVNRKARKAAFRAALSSHAQAGTLGLIDASAFAEPSTKSAAAFLEAWGKELPVLLVVKDDDEAVIKSFRNLDRVLVITPDELEVAAVLWARSLLVTEPALEDVQKRGAA